MPNRIETLRIRSGVRFIIRAASSSDTFALASSITRRSSAKDQDLPAICETLLSKDKAAERSMFADGFAWGPDEGNCPVVLSIAQLLDRATQSRVKLTAQPYRCYAIRILTVRSLISDLLYRHRARIFNATSANGRNAFRIGFDLVPRSPLNSAQMPANKYSGRSSLSANLGSGAHSENRCLVPLNSFGFGRPRQ
jgi:hypothetical protein